MIVVAGNQIHLDNRAFPCKNNTPLGGIYGLDLFDSKEVKDTTEYDEGWFIEIYPILPIDRENVIYVPRPHFEILYTLLEQRTFWEIHVT